MPWILEMVDLGEDVNSGTGDHIYGVNCAVCHGSERQGDPTGIYPSLKKLSQKYSREELLIIINSGRGIMPSFRHLTMQEKEALLNFLTDKKGKTYRQDELNVKHEDVPYTHKGYNRFLDRNGYPAIKPPWGNLSAIDLNKGVILWQIPFGESEELASKGILRTGTENYGGPALTATGIIFIAASKDCCFRAFDKDNGTELWKYKLPAGGYATPAVYEANGKQFIVIACGGGKMGTHSGDSYLAFALEN